jgi:hypothetical protein
MESNFEYQKISEFESNDIDVSRAIQEVKINLSINELDRFYIGTIDKKVGSIKIILYHYDLIKKIKSSEQGLKDVWKILPPLSGMPDLVKLFRYSIMKDDIIEDSLK